MILTDLQTCLANLYVHIFAISFADFILSTKLLFIFKKYVTILKSPSSSTEVLIGSSIVKLNCFSSPAAIVSFGNISSTQKSEAEELGVSCFSWEEFSQMVSGYIGVPDIE